MIRFTLTLVSILAICSCRTGEGHDPQIPKALDNQGSLELTSKRGYQTDLVESIYAELIENDKSLSDLENLIKKAEKTASDSTELFSEFDEKNDSFYKYAKNHAAEIKDTVLRRKIDEWINNSMNNYATNVLSQKNLMRELVSKQTTVADLHEALKITRTLASVESYQRKEMPGANALKNALKVYIKLQEKMDTMIHK